MDQGKCTAKQARYSHRLDDGRVECTVCPRLCKLRDGEIGACRVRGCRDRLIVPVTKQGRGPLRVEPIEAKGLTHFLPGTLTLFSRPIRDQSGCAVSGQRQAGLHARRRSACVARDAKRDCPLRP
jgi:hypothetical protein